MALHFLSRPWQIQDVEDGIRVTVTARELHAGTAVLAVDELFELTHECGQPNLYLDFSDVQSLSSEVFAQLVVLDRQLRRSGGRLALFNLNPALLNILQTSTLAELLDVHGIPLPRTP
jgi:anti-anti-sigma factor